MDISLENIQIKDAESLFEFELENRTFFEKMLPSRGDNYYDFEFFKSRHKALLDEQTQGGSYFYLIKNKNGSILGRMNLVDIDETQNLGHVGYRVGKRYIGKGIASKALKLLLKTANEKGLDKIKAKTTINNKASQIVLEKNGFKYISTSDEVFEIAGQSLKFVYYIWSK
ncbi:GNAT family N-acetyltransferase [Cytobacillus firmus]|uniref:GNAT family N-acetyltransferase n=1 Tax=Cytobacillus firmus TaxID=1399 RepID=UPI0018CD209F|nr:GNAT family N-acetyltransferase [Cytobacillus firmus]MBG9590182.1 acetyltransferase [Cytobacillus firmus]